MLKKLLLATTGIFLLFAVPAQAGPLIGGIGALVGSIGAGGLSLGSLAIGIASMGAQWLLSMMLAPEQKQRGIKTRMETGGDNPPTFIVGEYATAGQLIYANTLDKGSNIPEACLVYVICLSALPITAVSNEVFINNERCTIDEGSSWPGGFMEVDEYVKGGGGGYCLMKFHLGDQSSADNWLEDKFGNDPDRPWNSNMFLPGCAYAIVQCWYSNRGIWTGLPEFRFVVQGAPLYDPRKDSSVGGSGSHRWNNQNTWEYSRNAKVIEYNVHRGFWWDDKHQWGGKAQAYRLPLDYWFAAMNACDEDVPKRGGGTVKRYRIGAEISFDDKPIDVVNEINKSCSGYTTEFGGTYKTWAAGPGLPIATITDYDFAISADLETSPFQPMQLTYNTCYPTFPAPNQQWEVKDAPRYQDDDAFEEDGEELPLDLPLPFVTESSQVQRIARLAIKDSRRQVTHAGQLPPKAWVYEPFDPLAYVSTMFGYSGDGKTFIVANKDDLPNVMQQVLLREWNPNDEGWLAEYEQETDFAPLIVVKPGDLELDFDVFADQVESPAGKDKPAIRAEWTWGDGIDLDVRRVDWQIRRTGQTKVIAEKSILNPADGEALIVSNVLRWGRSYQIRFRPRPFAVRDSVWTSWKTVVMSSVDVPENLVLTQIYKEGADGKLDFFVKADWDDVAQEQNGYGVRVVIDGDTRYFRADDSKYRIAVKAPETVQVSVRTRAADGGTPSAWCTPETINVTKKATGPGVATGVSVTVKPNVNIVEWDMCTDDDYKISRVYRNTVNVFSGASIIGRVAGDTFRDHKVNKGTRYHYWVIHVNRSDNDSASASTSNFGDAVAIGTSDTDRTTLSAPTGISLTQANRDVDKDGTVDIALLTTFSGGVALATGYEVEWVDSAGQVASARADTGKYWFKANTIRSYQARWRAYDWTNQPGNWSSYSGSVTPAAVTGAPAAPSGTFFLGLTQNGVGISGGNTPSEFDYAFSEVSTNASTVIGNVIMKGGGPFVNGVAVFLNVSTTASIYMRHVNTSGLRSSWTLIGTVSNGNKIECNETVIGASASGSIYTPLSNGGAANTIVTLSWICGNAATGVSITIQDIFGITVRTFNVDFVLGAAMSRTVLIENGGTITASKTGGVWQNAVLTGIGIPI